MTVQQGFITLSVLILSAFATGCEAPNPNANTATSGRLILYVDEMYAPLVQALADTFMVRSPNAHIEVRSATARESVQGMLSLQANPPSGGDTTPTIAAIIGRKLLADEQDAVIAGELNLKEYVIGYDGVAVVVPNSSTIKETTIQQLRNALLSKGALLDSSAQSGAPVFILPDPNSSTYQVMHKWLLGDSDVKAPARYYSTSDSVLDRVAAGEGIALLGWYRAHRDSDRVRTLLLGHVDSNGTVHPPVQVHPASLVTGAYPFKQPLVGYTLALTNSLAVGFLAWMSRGQDAQYSITYQNFQPENVKLRLVLPESEP